MKIGVRFWGVARRLAGGDSREVNLPEGADIEALLDALDADSGFSAELERCAFAIGTQLVAKSQVLNDGDEVAVLPPVSGG